MSVRVIRMPDIGEGIAEVEVVAWHVQPGDTVTEDQVLADVMTEKATVEIPSPVAGRVLSLHGEIGQTMAVGADLIHIEVAAEGGDPGPEAQSGRAESAAESTTGPAAKAAAERGARGSTAQASEAGADKTGAAKAVADKTGADKAGADKAGAPVADDGAADRPN
ncbi:MAG TPA: 2-oxo acid dehydrogenase subunit E2, partial [Burkholderiaceae bacterium]|nr:2-oxo acid dehydrogenase subunit E2 [Burkholderiaceae bacterium]